MLRIHRVASLEGAAPSVIGQQFRVIHAQLSNPLRQPLSHLRIPWLLALDKVSFHSLPARLVEQWSRAALLDEFEEALRYQVLV
jgi:hypothetical protein